MKKIMQKIERKLNEECALFGVSLKQGKNAAAITFNGLIALQHRGQEGAGIAVLTDDKQIHLQKAEGLVSEIFTDKQLNKMPNSNLAVGHTRYSTTGNNTAQNVQPFLTEYLTGRIATAHNGNITNTKELRRMLNKQGITFAASSDTEAAASLIAFNALNGNDVTNAVIEAGKLLKGAFCLLVMSGENKLVAVRDPIGYRPLCIGENENGIVISSESCALDSTGFRFVRDIRPGEVIVIENGKIISESIELKAERNGLCIFEYVYFARPDSFIDGLSVYESRFNMGRQLALEDDIEADVVCGVPDSGLEAAMGYAKQSGIPLASGFLKNRYIGRSFIFPTQLERETAVRLKLNPLKINVEGKRIILVDDSIVRGTTGVKIIRLLRQAGAKEVHMRVSSPPFIHTCNYGTDIGSEDNLIANKMDIEGIRKTLELDSLKYISLDGLLKACTKCNLAFCTGCFTGDYGFDK